MVKQDLKNKKVTGENMIIPIRCYSCGKPVGHLWEDFLKRTAKENKKKVLDDLGMERYCCRSLFLGHVDLDIAAQFKKN